MKKGIVFSIITFLLFFLVNTAFPLTLVRVGYIDLDHIVKVYTGKYLDLEISMREKYIEQLQKKYSEEYYSLSMEDLNKLQTEISNQNDVLKTLKDNKFYFDNNEQLEDEVIQEIVQRYIMNAIKKTSEVEGFNLILDKTGNFIYGTEDINLTDKILFRLDEKLLDIQNSTSMAPLSLELEQNPVKQDQPNQSTNQKQKQLTNSNQ